MPVAKDLRAKILILSASVGGGHLRAAEAMELALRQTAPEAAIRNIDVLTLANKAFRRIYGKGYLDFANRAPHFLGYVYDLLDRPKDKEGEFEPDRLRVALEKLNMQPFLKLLQSETWDMVVNTHFLPAEIIGSLRSSGRISVPQVTVTTDFMTHRLWLQEPCEHYFAATAEGAVYLNSWGVQRERISVTGIPIHPVFCRRKERSECLKTQGLRGDRPIVLLLSGGFGVGPIETILQATLTVESPMEVVVVCGRNEELSQRLARQQPPRRHRVKILGYTSDIDELMAVADVVISKPGGLTSAEVSGAGQRAGHRQSHPRAGEPQFRLPSGKRSGRQDWTRGDSVLQNRHAAQRPQAARPIEGQLPQTRPAACRFCCGRKSADHGKPRIADRAQTPPKPPAWLTS